MKRSPSYVICLICATGTWLVGGFLKISMLSQLGLLLAIGCLLYTPVLFLESDTRSAVHYRLKKGLFGILCFTLVFLAAGEIALRIWFVNGASFGNHYGPIVKRFEQDFVYNRYAGNSRGPDIARHHQPGSMRVLVQGDSITWGQGVQSEQDLYTTRLLADLRTDNPYSEMAVMAQPGRELNGHLLELVKWGAEIRPDIIIYQFYINDLELNKQKQSRSKRFWRRAFFHRTFAQTSYFWYFLDFGLDNLLLVDGKETYHDYLQTYFAADTPEWAQAISVFRAWVREARRLTPNILIALYPSMNASGERSLGQLYQRFMSEAQTLGINVVDLWEVLGPLQGDVTRIQAGAYDPHPSAEVHKQIAEHLYRHLTLQFSDTIGGGD